MASAMPVISSCEVSSCFYNAGKMCHAPAINVGSEHAACDAFMSDGKGRHSARKDVGMVGACHIEEWFHDRAADGSDVIFAYPSGTPDDFAEPAQRRRGHTIPELRRRGLFRAHCTGHTPRDRRGLPRPSRRV